MVAAPFRVLVVDDSLLFRRVLRDALAPLPGVEVVGSAGDGRNALERIAELAPDLVTLDLEMPGMDGLEVLRRMREQRLPSRAVVVSSPTRDAARATLDALDAGAFDFVVKPSGTSSESNLATLRQRLGERIEALRAARPTVRPDRPAAAAHDAERSPRTEPPPAPPPRLERRLARCEVVAVGISTGGPDALRLMVPQLPADLPVPLLIVQHMPPIFTRSLAESLDARSRIAVREAEEGDLLRPGCAYVAPGGRQMKVERDGPRVRLRLTDDPPENSCRPAVDYLFRSLAEVHGPGTLGVVMTGMGSDGLLGCRALRKVGASLFAQDEASCTVFGMPRFPIAEGLVDAVVPLPEMASRIAARARAEGRP